MGPTVPQCIRPSSAALTVDDDGALEIFAHVVALPAAAPAAPEAQIPPREIWPPPRGRPAD